MNVFGIEQQNDTKVLSADTAVVSFDGGEGGSKAFAVGVNLQYTRNMQPVPTLGSGTHYSVGTPMGTITVEAFVTKDSDLADKLKIGEKCELTGSMGLTFGQGCNNQQGVKYTLFNLIGTAVSVRAQAGQGYIVEGFTANFNRMTRE